MVANAENAVKRWPHSTQTNHNTFLLPIRFAPISIIEIGGQVDSLPQEQENPEGLDRMVQT
jgi:hypothetical protein